MPLSDIQIELLKSIKAKLAHGDIEAIASITNKSSVHVSRVLNPEVDVFNEEIVDAAVQLLAEREKKLKSQVESINGTVNI